MSNLDPAQKQMAALTAAFTRAGIEVHLDNASINEHFVRVPLESGLVLEIAVDNPFSGEMAAMVVKDGGGVADRDFSLYLQTGEDADTQVETLTTELARRQHTPAAARPQLVRDDLAERRAAKQAQQASINLP